MSAASNSDETTTSMTAAPTRTNPSRFRMHHRTVADNPKKVNRNRAPCRKNRRILRVLHNAKALLSEYGGRPADRVEVSTEVLSSGFVERIDQRAVSLDRMRCVE